MDDADGPASRVAPRLVIDSQEVEGAIGFEAGLFLQFATSGGFELLPFLGESAGQREGPLKRVVLATNHEDAERPLDGREDHRIDGDGGPRIVVTVLASGHPTPPSPTSALDRTS